MKVLYCPQLDEIYLSNGDSAIETFIFYDNMCDFAFSIGWIQKFMKTNDFNMYYVGEL